MTKITILGEEPQYSHDQDHPLPQDTWDGDLPF